MENENENAQQPTGTENNYIEVIKNLKASTVSKDEYERVLQENKTLANAFATTPAASAEEPEVPVYTQKDIDNLVKDMSSRHMTNLEYAEHALDYRDAVIEVHGVDPFLPNGNGHTPTEEEKARAQKMADDLRYLVDYADGDASLFDSELKRCGR